MWVRLSYGFSFPKDIQVPNYHIDRVQIFYFSLYYLIKVLNTMDEGLIYADVDASETYSYGPLSYKTTSLQRAKKKKEEVAAGAVADSKV